MTIKTFTVNGFAINAFIISDETKECIFIDPGYNNPEEEEKLTRYVSENNLKPVMVLNTHCHVDHVLGNKFVCEKYNIPLAAHKDDSFLLAHANEMGKIFGLKVQSSPEIQNFIIDNDVIKFGNSELIVFHTPGHSPGSVSFYSPKDKIVIAGDVLFTGSIGRTDLPGGNYETLIGSIKNKLMVLPSDTVVYPGHGPSTTIGHEHDTNPFLQ